MMKKMICMLMVLIMMAASSALAMTFDEGVTFMLDMVRESMETQGRTYWFTECNEKQNQKFSDVLGYAYHARTSKDGKTYCTVNGHDGEMEIFTAATSVRGNYEDMIACALEVVRAYAGVPDQDMIKWVNDKGNQVLKQTDEVAFMYELKGGVLFLVEQWHETNYTAKPHYSVSVLFPCEETCPMTETVRVIQSVVGISLRISLTSLNFSGLTSSLLRFSLSLVSSTLGDSGTARSFAAFLKILESLESVFSPFRYFSNAETERACEVT